MKIEVYNDGTIVQENNNQLDILLDEGAYRLYTIEGIDWDDCIQKYYTLKSWGTYKPLDKNEKNI